MEGQGESLGMGQGLCQFGGQFQVLVGVGSPQFGDRRDGIVPWEGVWGMGEPDMGGGGREERWRGREGGWGCWESLDTGGGSSPCLCRVQY